MTSESLRSTPLSSNALAEFFSRTGGYCEMGNQELAGRLLRWNLLEESNRNDPKTAWSYLKWSLTASFLQLMNALQWLTAGILHQAMSELPAQALQMYYYSIFFSYGSFLALHGKGHYTVHIDSNGRHELRHSRRELWFNQTQPSIQLKEKGKGGEHETRANWFYEVFASWDQRAEHPAVLTFRDDQTFHSVSRNLYTYSLADMAEELHHDASSDPLPKDILLRLWRREPELPDYFPEEFWVLEHLKPLIASHASLAGTLQKGKAFTSVQRYLFNALLSRHANDGLGEFLSEALAPIAANM